MSRRCARLRRATAVAGLTLGFAATLASAAVEMNIVTNKGFVVFTVADDWLVTSMQSKLPIAAAAFQIPNPADHGTADSTDLAIVLYDSHSKRARSAFASPVKQYGSVPPEIKHVAGWKVYRQEALQGSTRYTVLDAKRAGIADVLVTVRLAWPHLDSNSTEYDAAMESIFREFLASIRGEIGPYVPHSQGATRRPER